VDGAVSRARNHGLATEGAGVWEAGLCFPQGARGGVHGGLLFSRLPGHATKPKTNKAFWETKLARNKARDRDVTRTLKQSGWRVVRVWECALARKRSAATVRRIARAVGHFQTADARR
jgi:G:T-mismatch repair DNA endonuclease (very short patch repair protein)